MLMHQITVFNNVSEHILSPSAHIGYILVSYRWTQRYPYLCLSTDAHTRTHTAELRGPAQQCVLNLGFP